MRLVLASASPRRAELLARAGYRFEVHPAAPEAEDAFSARWASLGAEVFAARLALLKAVAVARARPLAEEIILGADTIAQVDGELLGKPQDRAEARAMLRRMCGREHEVVTGVALLARPSGQLRMQAVTTVVALGAWDEELVEDYVAGGFADGKAGAYGLQDALIGPLIAELRGCPDNVVGLPVSSLAGMLRELGVEGGAGHAG